MQVNPSSFASRCWIPKGSSITFASGFFDPDVQSPIERQQQITFQDSINVDVPCIVLLGPPGIGKSTEFLRASNAARNRGFNVHFVPLRGISSFEMLENELFHLGILVNTDLPRFVFLDSLDEAAVTIPVMQQWLLKVAEKARQLALGGQRVLLRLSCRTTDWSEQFEEQLRQVWGKDAVQVFELPPLTRPQATEFIESNKARTQEFFAAIEDGDAEAFASRPVTLKMLISTFVTEGALSHDKVTIYRRGLLALLEESNPARRAGGATGDLSPEQRFAVAARIAAASVLSTRRVIWDGLYSDLIPSDAIPVADLAGDVEEAFGDRISSSSPTVPRI